MIRLRSLPPRLSALDTRTARPPPKTPDAVYHTPDFRAWRAEVIRRSSGTCQGKDCGRTGVRLFADHIVELRDGGAPFDVANGQALCGSCHSLKTAAARAARMAK